MSDSIVVAPGEGERLQFGPSPFEIKARFTGSDAGMAFVDGEFQPGTPSPPAHVHRSHDEGFYVISGEMEFVAGDETVRAGPGTLVIVARGTRHTYSFPGSDPVRVLAFLSPPEAVQYVVDLGGLITGGPPDPERVQELYEKYDTEHA